MSLKSQINLLRERILFSFPILRIQGRLVFALPDRWKSTIRWTKWVLAAVGLLTSLVSFGSVLISFGTALILFLLGLLLEKILFRYRTMYVSPFPDFELDQSNWTACFFGYMTPPNRSIYIPIVGWVFRDTEYAKKIHGLLSVWLAGDGPDRSRNICQSVILDDNRYHFFCYPSPERASAKAFHKRVEAQMKRTKDTRDDLHDRLFVSLALSKTFDLLPTSFLPTFRARYSKGEYVFRIAVMSSEEPQSIEGLHDFVLFDLKIKELAELSRRDMEYGYMKVI